MNLGAFFVDHFSQTFFGVVLKDHQAERWQAEIQGVLVTMDAPLIGGLATKISQIAAAVFGSIRIEDFLVEARDWNAHLVIGMTLGGEVCDHHEPGAACALTAHEADDGMTVVIAIDPLEAVLIKIVPPESRLVLIERIELSHHPLDARVRLVVQQIPLQIAPYVPFSALTELHAHEDRFLAWVRPHVGE